MEKNLNFRTLIPEDIEIRIGTKGEKATMFLLYKNARVDMNILDETVGPLNWARDHKELKGNLFCGVGINTGAGYVWKWDCGAESSTEKEKGEASDSFKRACVNWGIGRELYSTPKIMISNSKLTFSEKGYLQTPLAVSFIAYDESRKIKDLAICDTDTLATVWEMRDGEICVGIGAKNSSARNTSRPKSAPKPKSETSAPENAQEPQKRLISISDVRAGRCKTIIKKLSERNPNDFADWETGLNELERKYDLDFGVAEALEDAVRAFRSNPIQA